MQTGKAMIQVEFPMNALSENTKNTKFKMLSFCQKIIFSVSNIFMQIFKVSTF